LLHHAVGNHQINDLFYMDAQHAFWSTGAVDTALTVFWRKDWL
jgi:hypothetical protein